MATAAVAAAVAKARRDVQHHFFSQDAVRPDSAVLFEPRTRLQRKQFERMLARGIVRQANNGLYWLDVVAYDADHRAHLATVRTVLLVVVFGVLIALLASLYLV